MAAANTELREATVPKNTYESWSPAKLEAGTDWSKYLQSQSSRLSHSLGGGTGAMMSDSGL